MSPASAGEAALGTTPKSEKPEAKLAPLKVLAPSDPGPVTTLSERSWADSQAAMGYGTTRGLERVLASCGLLLAASLKFVPAADVPQAGVLCALPALLTEGLLRHTRAFYHLPPGYYPLEICAEVVDGAGHGRCILVKQKKTGSSPEGPHKKDAHAKQCC